MNESPDRESDRLSRRALLRGAIAGAGLVAAGCSRGSRSLATLRLPPELFPPSSSAAARRLADGSGTIRGALRAETLDVGSGQTLRFDPTRDTTLEMSGNLVVNGRLEMRPEPGVEHILRFVEVDESAFVGGGLDPVSSDVGLWVVGDGVLDIRGTRRDAWNRTGSSRGWRAQDDLIVAPVEPGDFVPKPFAIGDPVPRFGEHRAEVLNLTRNVRIEGTPGGRAHVFIRSTRPQTIRHALLRHLGPRQANGEQTTGVLGRYALHFHHAHEGSRGSVVEGVVVRDSGNHGFVPHMSHGITLQSCIAYEVFDEAYWWDPDEATNDLLIDRCVAASVHFDPEVNGYRLAGFLLGEGSRLRLRDSVAFAVQGGKTSAGYVWPEAPSGPWEFTGNLAHNNAEAGIFVWQNNSGPHTVDGFVAYHNGGSGITHGAYSNAFHYRNLDLRDQPNAIELHAVSRLDPRGRTMSWKDVQGGGLYVGTHVIAPHDPVLFFRCRFPEGVTIDDGEREPGPLDFVDCGLEPADFHVVTFHPDTVIRVQDRRIAFELTAAGVRDIEPFFAS